MKTGLKTALSLLLILGAGYALKVTYAQRQHGTATSACAASDFHAMWRTGSGALSTDNGWLELDKTTSGSCTLEGMPELVVASPGAGVAPVPMVMDDTLQTWNASPATTKSLATITLSTGAIVGVAVSYPAQSVCPYASKLSVRLNGMDVGAAPMALHTQCDGGTIAQSSYFVVSQG